MAVKSTGGGTYAFGNRNSKDSRIGGGIYGTMQNQPGLSDFGRDSGGAYHSTNIIASKSSPARDALMAYWAQLQQQYPQYTNHAQLNFPDDIPPQIAGQGGGGGIWINNKQLDSSTPAFAKFLLAKELGQAVQERTVATNARGDKLMNLWNQRTPAAAADRVYGLPNSAWTPTTDFAHLPNAIDVGSYRTYPADAYGIQFAANLGQYLPGVTPGSHNLLSGPALAYAQMNGLVPTPYSRPTMPQQPQPNVSDLGRGINNARMPARAPAVLPAQVNNPAFQAMQQRAAQQNSANAAMRGGPRNF